MKFVITVIATIFMAADLQAGLVARYDFEEGTGVTASDSANPDGTATPNDDGTIVNASYTPGVIGTYAMRFSGSSSYVSLEPGGQNNDLLNASSGATFAAWVKLELYPSDIATVVFVSTATNSLNSRGGLFISGNGFVEVAGRAGDSSSFQSRLSSTQIPLDEWIHLAGVIDYANDTIAIYFDGQLQALQPGSLNFAGTTTSSANSAESTLGSTGGVFEFLSGSLDDVRIYDEALGAAAIMQTVPEPSLSLLFFTGVIFLLCVKRRVRECR